MECICLAWLRPSCSYICQVEFNHFSCINTPEGIILYPDRSKNIARQISAIHDIDKDISQQIGSLIMLTWDGKCIPALSNTLIYLHFQQLFAFTFNSCLLTWIASLLRRFRSTIMRCHPRGVIVICEPLLELNDFSTLLVWIQRDPGGQLHVRRWVSQLVTLQRIPISILRREVNSCSLRAKDNCREKRCWCDHERWWEEWIRCG